MSDTSQQIKAPAYDKPLPNMDPGTEPFWMALRRHELVYQRCRQCGHQFVPYQPVCPSCWAEEFEECKSSGLGTIYTFSVVYRAPTPAFRADLPYVVALVELEEGFYLTTNIVGCPVDQVRIGLPVEVEYADVTAEITLARFRSRVPSNDVLAGMMGS